MQFGRTYELTIARPIETNYIRGTDESPLYRYQPVLPEDFDPESFVKDVTTGTPSVQPKDNSPLRLAVEGNRDRRGDGTLRITENHVVFDVSKKDSGSANKTEIKVYNLSDTSIGYLDAVSGKGVLVSLNAGYQGRNRLLVFGTLEGVQDQFNGVDRITTLKVTEGGKFIRDSLMSKYYPKGTSVGKIVNELTQNLGIVRGVFDPAADRAIIASPFYVGGSTYQELLRLGKTYGFKASIQDLSLNFVKEVPENTTEGVSRIAKVFTPDSGLVGFVTIDNDNTGKTNVDSKEPQHGVAFSVLLDGTVKVGTLIKLEGVKNAGVYRVTEVKHTGSLEGQKWTTDVKAEKADFR